MLGQNKSTSDIMSIMSAQEEVGIHAGDSTKLWEPAFWGYLSMSMGKTKAIR